ncbi:393_t:CDS:10, partial [Acaulospora morrowiae]
QYVIYFITGNSAEHDLTFTMDIVKAVQNYINKMVNEVTGMKVLLLDAETTPIISNVMTQSSLLSHETYLVDRIDNRNRDRLRHLKCICFLRPTSDTIQLLVEELRDPCYGDYYLCKSSNTLKKSAIERLAEVDEHEVVREEYFADYCAINSDFFSLNLSLPQHKIYGDSLNTWDGKTLQRITEGILAVLLSLKKKPLIRYEKTSVMAMKLATEVHYQIQQEGQLFDFRKTDTPPILLILDRRNDPVTPLLSQWTYQAMVHELLGIHNGRVGLYDVPDIRPELKEIVLSPDQDPFYKKNMYLNLGDLGANIKSYVEEYQTKTKSSMNIESIADMKRFVEEYPEFRKLSGNVSKHVALVSELSRLVEKENLLEVSELEQSLACYEQHASDLKNLLKIIASSNVSDDSKIRLVLLYSLRYEKSPNNSITSLIDELHRHGVSIHKISLIESMIQFAGADQRQNDLFSNESFFSRGKSAFKGLKGVENVYTQHSPYLARIIELLLKNKLKDTNYPFVDGGTKDRPQDIIIFMVGGTTYEEARHIAQINTSTPGVRIVLGGTTVHNSESFLNEIQETFYRFSPTGATGAMPSRFGRSRNGH